MPIPSVFDILCSNQSNPQEDRLNEQVSVMSLLQHVSQQDTAHPTSSSYMTRDAQSVLST